MHARMRVRACVHAGISCGHSLPFTLREGPTTKAPCMLKFHSLLRTCMCRHRSFQAPAHLSWLIMCAVQCGARAASWCSRIASPPKS